MNWCCHGFRLASLVCLLDNVNHAVLGRHCIRRVCDWHDAAIWREWKDPA